MSDAGASTPLMEQYEGVKARYPGHLVLFRVGDFYETFGDDARLLSRELEVVLTARSADARGERTPMAGVPHHAVETYLGRLVRKGYKVAVCDQVEDARFAKGLVRREVTRVVTPGTVVEERILAGPDHSFLACVALGTSGVGALSAVDITTGEWVRDTAGEPGIDGLVSALAAFSPREILVAPGDEESVRRTLEAQLKREFPRVRIEPAPPPIDAVDLPAALSGPTTTEVDLRLAAYVRATQPRLLPFLEPIDRVPGNRRLRLDSKTLRHLEISRPMNPDDPGGVTLLSSFGETATASGHRTLDFWLKNPLADPVRISERQDRVEALRQRGAELAVLRAELGRISDLSRIAARLASRRLRPHELLAVRESLAAVGRTRDWLRASEAPALEELWARLDPLPALQATLAAAVPEDLSANPAVGEWLRPGFSPEVDALVSVERSGVGELERLESEEQRASGIRTLKIGYNQVFGYYFDVSRPNLSKVLPHFRRKQTLSGGERYTSDALSAIEERILSAREQLGETESRVYESFLAEVERSIPALHRLSRAIGELDTLSTFAHIARTRGHHRPTVDAGRRIQIRDGRHPVLERVLSDGFVPNDTDLDADGERLWVLTGPNMSGKSTYMRQVGLFVVLAQAGAFVPARFAQIGVVSSLFTRMGFTDEIGRGKSSFMVEMTEVAEILRSADDRSLVLLDEVGRGTSTFDGLALAWATLEHLHDRVGCRTLLATHYHQLTELIERLPGARNAHLAVREEGGEVVFLHRLVPGSTDRSYGLHVARLAGLPPELLREAQRMLQRLEADGVAIAPGDRKGRPAPARYTQAVLLSAEAPAVPSPVEEALRELDPERLTPIDALHWVAEWRRRLGPPGAGAPP
ncbi:MAG: DNA mismatch repair protein MutS [Thermoplasmata archaeon]|nr:DNA mismatch repair protein MutS [Thermoplasmata archaeon]